MNDDDIIEDLTIKNKTFIIIERKYNYNKITRKWSWSTPKTIKYKKLIENAHFDIIKQLISSNDLQTALSSAPDLKQETLDSGISSPTWFSDNTSTKTEANFWEAPKLTLGHTYLVYSNKKTWPSAELTSIDGDGLHLVCTKSREFINSSCKYVAHPQPVDSLLNVGTRVVAFATKIQATGEMKKGRKVHELGVVGEYPTPANGYRYLVIFDKSFWLYVKPNEIWPIYYQSKTIWEILPDQRKKEVKNVVKGRYLPLTEYKKGDSIKYTSSDGGICHGVVLCVDVSLILVWFTYLGKSEWIHRGSFNLVKS